MKIRGKQLVIKNQRSLTFERDDGSDKMSFTVLVSPTGMGWLQRMLNRGIGVFPDPPKIPLKDPDKPGNYIVNPDTGAVELYHDEQDGEYRIKYELAAKRSQAMQFREHLRDDPGVDWDTKFPGENVKQAKWLQAADDLVQEILESGFTDEEVSYVCRTGNSLGCVANLDKAVDDFLPPGQQPSEADEASSKTPPEPEKPAKPSSTSGASAKDSRTGSKSRQTTTS